MKGKYINQMIRSGLLYSFLHWPIIPISLISLLAYYTHFSINKRQNEKDRPALNRREPKAYRRSGQSTFLFMEGRASWEGIITVT